MSNSVLLLTLLAALLAGILGNILANYLEKHLNNYRWFRFKSRQDKLLIFLFLFILLSTPSIIIQIIGNIEPPLEPLIGDFNVAVVPFSIIGNSTFSQEISRLNDNIANEIIDALNKFSRENKQNYQIDVLRPDSLQPIDGNTQERRAINAQELASLVNADIVLYGRIETDGPNVLIKPEFYINNIDYDSSVSEAISGHHEVTPIVVAAIENNRSREEAVTKLSNNFKVFIWIFEGILVYTLGEYITADKYFTEAIKKSSKLDSWKDNDLLYLLRGNNRLKQGELLGLETQGIGNPSSAIDWFDLAAQDYQTSITSNPKYSRAYVGYGSIYYLRGINPKSTNYNDVNLDLMRSAIVSYSTALNDKMEHPPLAYVPTKARFGLGMANFMKMMKLASVFQQEENRLSDVQKRDVL